MQQLRARVIAVDPLAVYVDRGDRRADEPAVSGSKSLGEAVERPRQLQMNAR